MRIAIVNDVALAVEAMRRVLVHAHEHEVAWIARDGSQAVELCARDTPDLILMDLIMPKLDGVEATRRIMARTPCAILVVTANVTDNTSQVFEAMGAGALDAVNTPVLDCPGACKGTETLLAKIANVRRLLGLPNGVKVHGRPAVPVLHRSDCLVAIGASAGGPAALAKLLAHLPANFPAAIVIVQHVDTQFAQGLANWLDYQTPLKVHLAQEGDRPQRGTVLLAGRENHLVFTPAGRLAYTRHPLECSYRPSIDVFFQSADHHWPGDILGILLTGMGRDGAEGLRGLRLHGHHTIAQDERTCALYGMPKAAAEIDAATEILPLEKIAPRLTHLLSKKLKIHA